MIKIKTRKLRSNQREIFEYIVSNMTLNELSKERNKSFIINSLLSMGYDIERNADILYVVKNNKLVYEIILINSIRLEKIEQAIITSIQNQVPLLFIYGGNNSLPYIANGLESRYSDIVGILNFMRRNFGIVRTKDNVKSRSSYTKFHKHRRSKKDLDKLIRGEIDETGES